MSTERYTAISSGSKCTWYVFDKKRNCRVLKSVSGQATYNESVCKAVVESLNNNRGNIGNLISELLDDNPKDQAYKEEQELIERIKSGR